MYLRHSLFFVLLLSTLFALAGRKKAYLQDFTLQPAREQLGAKAHVNVIHDKKQPKGFIRWTLNGQHTLASPIDDQNYLVHINNMRYWSQDDPITYTVSAAWGTDSLSRMFGIHNLANNHGCISVNDISYLLRGLAEEALPIGEKTTEQQWFDFFRQIMAEEFNFVTLRSYMLTQALLDAADRSGMMVHVTKAEAPLIDETAGKKKKKKKKAAPVIVQTLEEQWGNHPSLCLLTGDGDARGGIAGPMLRTHVFNPELAERNGHLMDYAQMVDTAAICLADLSRLTQPDSLDVVLERALCTDGVGGIVFASREQAKVLKPLMILKKTDRDFWDSSMSMRIPIYVANTTRQAISGLRMTCEFLKSDGEKVLTEGNDYGSISNLRFEPRSVRYVDDAFSSMGSVTPGTWLTVKINLEGADLQRTWRTKIAYPSRFRLVNEMVDKRMSEWCKIRAGESNEQYRTRVNGSTKDQYKMLCALEATNEMAAKDKGMGKFKVKLSPANGRGFSTVSVGKGVADFKIQVPKEFEDQFIQGRSEAGFGNPDELEIRNTQFSLSNKNKYEVVYTEIYNTRTGASIVYDNRDNITLEHLFIDDKYVTDDIRDMVEREDSTLKVIKKQVVDEAKREQLITSGTKMNVSSKVLLDYDDQGQRQNNYQMVFEYNVDAHYSLTEDFGPGRYHIEDSHAALSMLKTITSSFAQGFGRYIVPGKRLEVVITGSADASPIRGAIRYDGFYGHFQNHPYYLGQKEEFISIDQENGITTNEQLAFLRAQGVYDFLEKNLTATKGMDVDYRFKIELPKGRGSQFRRIKVAFIFVDAFDITNEEPKAPNQ